MIAITKSMIALSALVSAGLVAAVHVVGPRADAQSAAAQVEQRFPLTSEMFSPVPMTRFVAQKFTEEQRIADGRKADRLPVSEICTQQDWPYFTQQCLASAEGKPARKVSRVITIERRTGDSSSELLQVPVADLAQR